MGRVRRSGTTPELAVRRIFSSGGIRYRLKNRDLPGAPDLANRRQKWVVFVHGCYWHRHRGCARATTPKTNTNFWAQKFLQNQARDASVIRSLRAMGFRVIVIWECQVNWAGRRAVRLLHK
jgi:DNA mismatch endonuclease (patch repair protein)